MPYEIEISKIVTKIPPPDAVADKGPYHPRKLKARERHIQSHKCKGDGELPLFMLERYGLPITEEDRAKAEREADSYARKFSSRKVTWENRQDWGNWWKAAELEEERRERARTRRQEREQSMRDQLGGMRPGAGEAPGVGEAPAEGDDEGLDDEGALDPKN